MEVSRYPLDFAPAPPTQEITEWMQLTRFRIRGKQFLIWAMDFLRRSSAAVAKRIIAWLIPLKSTMVQNWSFIVPRAEMKDSEETGADSGC